MKRQSIVRVVGMLLMPYIMLFALYIQFHGEYGPGGGFQAGVVFAAAFIIHTLLFGVKRTLQIAPVWLLKIIASAGVLLFTLVGVASMLLGANFLDYDVLASNPIAGQHLGIILVELGVGLTVASVVMLLFFAFAERGEQV
jgi:multicomponent Na+:H+ antiporter subunit B